MTNNGRSFISIFSIDIILLSHLQYSIVFTAVQLDGIGLSFLKAGFLRVPFFYTSQELTGLAYSTTGQDLICIEHTVKREVHTPRIV